MKFNNFYPLHFWDDHVDDKAVVIEQMNCFELPFWFCIIFYGSEPLIKIVCGYKILFLELKC